MSDSVLQTHGSMPGPERLPQLQFDEMDEAQKAAAQELASGPRGGVKGPFIPLLRSPELMSRLQRVGEYLRFHSPLETRIKEFAMLVVSRYWTQQFEWAVHHPLALKAGVKQETLEALGEGRRPPAMASDEAIVYDLCEELFRVHGLCDASYRSAIDCLGERGLIDLLGLLGYFSTVSMVMNVARTPPEKGAQVAPLQAYPR
jgi:4-carboxymuconolactone decarboxylase